MARQLSKTMVNKHSRNAFMLTNKAGQLGRQGVRGPVELAQKAGVGTGGTSLRGPKKKRTPRARS
jgi:hypothetical protein